MTPFKRNSLIHCGTLLFSLLMAQSAAFAAPPSRVGDGIKISDDDIRVNRDFNEREYDWWRNNCLDIGIGDNRNRLNCDNMDSKYRDHHNRSIHSGNNPGQGHKKNKNKGNGKRN